MKKVLMLVLVAVLSIALISCGQEGNQEVVPEETATAQESGAEETAAQESETAAAESAEVTIGGLVHVENQWGSMLMAGMQSACDEAGVNFVSSNYNEDNAKEMEILNTYAATNVDGICASVLETSVEAYREISEQGIPVGMVNLDMENDFSVADYTYSNYGLGEALVPYATEFVQENLDGKPVYHTIRVIAGSVADDRGNAFADGMAAAFGEEYGKPVSESSTYDPQEAIQQTADALTANPDINIIFCECESSALGAMSAIENAGLVGEVFVFAVDCSEQMCEYILDENNPTLQAASAQNSFEMGYEGCKALVETVLGQRTDYVPGEVTYLEAAPMTKGNLDDVQAFYDMLKSYSS